MDQPSARDLDSSTNSKHLAYPMTSDLGDGQDICSDLQQTPFVAEVRRSSLVPPDEEEGCRRAVPSGRSEGEKVAARRRRRRCQGRRQRRGPSVPQRRPSGEPWLRSPPRSRAMVEPYVGGALHPAAWDWPPGAPLCCAAYSPRCFIIQKNSGSAASDRMYLDKYIDTKPATTTQSLNPNADIFYSKNALAKSEDDDGEFCGLFFHNV
ncbi:hypothetical protein MRX96_027260 [Rhipicephalus microplus]